MQGPCAPAPQSPPMIPSVSTAGAVRRRVLASAYACEPGRGSEPGIGWNLARQIALRHELTLVTRENNVDAVRAAAAAESIPMDVVGHDLPAAYRFWKRGPRGAMAYYYLWQRALARVAVDLCSTRPFDLCHHLTFASGWLPSGLSATGLPFVFGPVGEHPRVPGRFLPSLDLVARGGELARATARHLVPTLDRSVQATWDAADVILSLGSAFGDRIPAAYRDRVAPMLACGFGGEELHEPTTRPAGTPLRVLFAGRLVDLKGVSIALRAFALASDSTSATLDVVGDGPRRRHLERLAAELGARDRVTFHGHVPHREATAAMARADVFLFPSFEGGGMVVPEAMAAGCAVVCLAVGGPGSMVGATRGLAVSPEGTLVETASEVAKAIVRLGRSEVLRLRVAEAGHEWARRSMTWDSKGAALTDIYERALRIHAERARAAAA